MSKTEKHRAAQSRYRASAKGRETQRRYRASGHGATVSADSNARRVWSGSFYVGIAPTNENVGSIPLDWIEDIHESEAWTAFLYWARFSDQGVRWEVVYDPPTRRNRYREVPPTQPQLDARVRKTGRTQFVLDIENTGDVPVEEVEVDLPPDARNWGMLTEALAAYPIRVLDPGDTQSVHLAVAMGGPASVEAVVRGRVDGVPYERPRTISVIG